MESVQGFRLDWIGLDWMIYWGCGWGKDSGELVHCNESWKVKSQDDGRSHCSIKNKSGGFQNGDFQSQMDMNAYQSIHPWISMEYTTRIRQCHHRVKFGTDEIQTFQRVSWPPLPLPTTSTNKWSNPPKLFHRGDNLQDTWWIRSIFKRVKAECVLSGWMDGLDSIQLIQSLGSPNCSVVFQVVFVSIEFLQAAKPGSYRSSVLSFSRSKNPTSGRAKWFIVRQFRGFVYHPLTLHFAI